VNEGRRRDALLIPVPEKFRIDSRFSQKTLSYFV
jgi:hypothetical protein